MADIEPGARRVAALKYEPFDLGLQLFPRCHARQNSDKFGLDR